MGDIPKILEDEIVGEEANKLFVDAQKMLKKALENNWLDIKKLSLEFGRHTQ